MALQYLFISPLFFISFKLTSFWFFVSLFPTSTTSIFLSSAYHSSGLFCYLLHTSLLVYFVIFCLPLSWSILLSSVYFTLGLFCCHLLTSLLVYFVIFCLLHSRSILLSSAYLSPGLFCYLLYASLLVYFVIFDPLFKQWARRSIKHSINRSIKQPTNQANNLLSINQSIFNPAVCSLHTLRNFFSSPLSQSLPLSPSDSLFPYSGYVSHCHPAAICCNTPLQSAANLLREKDRFAESASGQHQYLNNYAFKGCPL
jgi:hypothetical protein